MKYWAKPDLMKLADTEGVIPPQDAFKTDKREKKTRKFDVPDKVTNIDHWPKTDRIGDPIVKPTPADGGNQKWTHIEDSLRCDGPYRGFRTMEKVMHRGRTVDKEDGIRE